MLSKIDAHPNLAVSDLRKARTFYEDTLGFKPLDEMDGVVRYQSGQNIIMVYVSEFAGTNQATAVSWEVPDLEKQVRTLEEKHVKFQHYNMDGMTRHGAIHKGYGMAMAWFKDPSGNILHLIQK